jgi:hypothetical protein
MRGTVISVYIHREAPLLRRVILTLDGRAWNWSLGRRSATQEVTMSTPMVQQVVEYLKAHPEIAKKARDYVMAHPDDVKTALKDLAEERGWDLSKIDTAALKAELSKIH